MQRFNNSCQPYAVLSHGNVTLLQYMFFLSNNNKYMRTGQYLKNTKSLIDTFRLILKVYPESFKQQFQMKNNLDAIVQLELVYTKVVKNTNLDFI